MYDDLKGQRRNCLGHSRTETNHNRLEIWTRYLQQQVSCIDAEWPVSPGKCYIS